MEGQFRMEHLVCERSRLVERKPVFVNVEGMDVGVVVIKDQVHAVENSCPHAEGPVCLGDVSNRVRMKLDENKLNRGEYASPDEVNIVCPWHGLEFDIASGVCTADSRFKLHKLAAIERDGKIYISL